ncbi:uncharacterized protein LOC114737664 isoform X2 [Neltuma alba]|uniref:uncharacterized protein LOC114737664 isoform X2 n=1 Tax=Neltuma alba TaxID=207710 RepID=UPI0010A4E0F1|nr:uncharacterized protein LOC114737664 isoform X2 [Prosopis alba]
MEEDTELEEGEARYNNEDDNNIDIDSLSYIDERIQHVLGHFQRDFEGGVSAENLGAKFGGYGSFLPTIECPCLLSHSETLQRNHNPPVSPKKPHNVEAVPDNSKSSSIITPSMCLKIGSGSIQSCHTLKAPKVDDSMKKDVEVSSNEVADRFPFKDDSANKSGKSTDQRTLKFRIKMKSNMSAQNNAAIYSGLGLDNTPSSSMGNSPDENEGMLAPSQETCEESPTAIIQVMSSFPIPGGVLLSPLHETLLYLMRKENVLGDRNPMSSHNVSQEHCSRFAESDSLMRDEQLLNKRNVRIVGQSKKQLEMKRKNGNGFEKKITLHKTKIFENKTPRHKDLLSSGLKCTPLSSFCDAGEVNGVAGKASGVSMEVSEDAMKARTVFSEAVKGESLESISGQDFDRTEKQHAGNSFMENVSEHKANSLKDNCTDSKNGGKCKANLSFKKIECDAIQFKVHQDSHNHHTNQKGEPVFEGKDNSKGDHSSSKAVAIGGKDNSGAGNNALKTDKKRKSFGVTSCKSQMHITKSLKDYKVRDSNGESLKENSVEHPWHRAIASVNCDNAEGRSAYRIKIKERPSGKKMGDQLISELSSCPIAEKKTATEMAPAPVPQDDWVGCDSCEKWRLLPLGVKPEQLPEKWLCSMLNWLPGMNRCDISEEETTKAVYALNQMPNSGSQNNQQSHASGTASGASSAGPLHSGMNRQKSNFDVMSGRGKKKQDFRDETKAGINSDAFVFSKSLEIDAQESGQTRLLTDMSQCPGNSSSMGKSSDQCLIKLNNLNEEKHMPNEKVKQVKRGDKKNIQLRCGIEAISGASKRSKTEDVHYSDGHLNRGTDQDMVEPISRKCSSMKVSWKCIEKYGNYCLSEDTKDKSVVPPKKLEDQAQVLSSSVALGEVNVSNEDESMKKRKLKDWMDDKKQNNLLSRQDCGQYREEGSVSGFRKERKRRVLKTQINSDAEGDIEFDQKGGRSRICLSGSRDDMDVDTEEIGNSDKAQQRRKHKIKVASQRALDCNDPLGRDLRSEQLSSAATSSSSMISGSYRVRTNFQDVKVSPVESITSTPLRTSNLDKLIFAERDTSGKDASRKGDLSSMSSRGSKEEKKLMERKKKVLDDLLPEQNQIYSTESLAEDGKPKVPAKTSEVRHDHLLSGGNHAIDHGNCVSGTLHEDGVNKNSGLSSCESGPEARNDVKFKFPEPKHEIDNISNKNSVRSWSSEAGMKIRLKPKDFENSVLKVDIPCTTKRSIVSRRNLSQNFEKEDKADCLYTELTDGKLRTLSSSDCEVRRETLFVSSRTGPEAQKGYMFNGHSVHASGNSDLTKLLKSSADARSKVRVGCNSGSFAPDQPHMSSPVRSNSSLTASVTLDEATKIKDMADNFKNSGFEFESNETYFEAALKFLHGASLLECCHNEGSKHGEMSQMQIYATTAKLFKSCAHEYQRRQEMAAAALAYKCMEVACMRLVYCKHSSANRMWHELQSTLNMVPQGESPSSSISDVDSLINQAAVDKTTLSRSTGIHFAANQVISVQNHSTFFHLLDFTQDVNLAMEASRKCQSTFAAASTFMEAASNKEYIASIRRVIDFSFQDVDELVRLDAELLGISVLFIEILVLSLSVCVCVVIGHMGHAGSWDEKKVLGYDITVIIGV